MIYLQSTHINIGDHLYGDWDRSVDGMINDPIDKSVNDNIPQELAIALSSANPLCSQEADMDIEVENQKSKCDSDDEKLDDDDGYTEYDNGDESKNDETDIDSDDNWNSRRSYPKKKKNKK